MYMWKSITYYLQFSVDDHTIYDTGPKKRMSGKNFKSEKLERKSNNVNLWDFYTYIDCSSGLIFNK